MKYAFIGDLHSNIADTVAVLEHIKQIAQNANIIGLGDLYECTIGKKKATIARNINLHDAAIISEEFEKLLTFPSIRGNQEERITLVTGNQHFMQYPEIINIDHAILMHGHQFQWDKHWRPTFPVFQKQLLFFGHSHESAIYDNNIKQIVPFNQPFSIASKQYAINVGSVVTNREWCMYDSAEQTVTFMKAF